MGAVSHELGINPQFDLTWGDSFDYEKRMAVFNRPAGKRRIRVDFAAGGTSNTGDQYVTNTIANAKGLVRNLTGDVIALPGGGSCTNVTFGDMGLGTTGLSKRYPTRFIVYDPADPLNEAKDNTLRFSWICDQAANPGYWASNGGTIFLFTNRVGGSEYFSFRNIDFIADDFTFGKSAMGSFGGANSQCGRILVEGCTFKNLNVGFQTNLATLSDLLAQPATNFAQDITIRKCGTYGGVGVNAGFLYISGLSNFHYHDCFHVWGGRAPWTSRASGADDDSLNAVTGASGTLLGAASSSGITFTVASTAAAFVGGRAQAYTALGGTGSMANNSPAFSIVTAILNSTQFTVAETPTTPFVAQGVVLQKIGGDYLRHTDYMTEVNRFTDIRRNVSFLETANAKWTSGPTYVEDIFHVRDPMGPIMEPKGNDTTNSYHPQGRSLVINKITQIGADDISTGTFRGTPNGRGWGPSVYGGGVGTRIAGALLMNNQAPSGGRTGVQSSANGTLPYQSYCRIDNMIEIGFGTNDPTAQTNHIKEFVACITDDTNLNVTNGSGSAMTTGTGNMNRATAAVAEINALASYSVHDTFRKSLGDLFNATTVVNSNTTFDDQSATLKNMGIWMASNAPNRHWADELGKSSRRRVGR